jgi:DNA modification methylase
MANTRSKKIEVQPAAGLKSALQAKSRRRRETQKALTSCEKYIGGQRNDILPKLELVERRLDDLRVPKRKLRKLDPFHVSEVVIAIINLGFRYPILISDTDEVIDGAVRIEAMRQLGQDRISCIVVNHLSEAELRLLRISVNRLAEKGMWDIEALRLEFEELIVLEAPIEISGFDLEQIDQILLDDDTDSAEPGQLAPASGAIATSRFGDIWRIGAHILICGDARDHGVYERLFDDGERARLILTDPPFNVRIAGHVTRGAHREFLVASGELTEQQFFDFNKSWMNACLPHLVDGGLIASFIDWRGLPVLLPAAASLDLKQLNLVVWGKTNGGQGGFYRSAHELLPIWKLGNAPHVNNIELGRHGRWRSNLWIAPGASSLGSDSRDGLKLHPTVKPTALLEDALVDLTRRGEIVTDPFLGSGSTMVAADKVGRVCRGLELDPLYCDVIVRRMKEVIGKDAILVATGETFATVAQRRAEQEV